MIHFELNRLILLDSLQDIWPDTRCIHPVDVCFGGYNIYRSGQRLEEEGTPDGSASPMQDSTNPHCVLELVDPAFSEDPAFLAVLQQSTGYVAVLTCGPAGISDESLGIPVDSRFPSPDNHQDIPENEMAPLSGNSPGIPENVLWIQVPGCASFSELCSHVHEIFDRYARWERKLYDALEGSNPLDEILEASIPIFQNPMFVHDTYFYILSCPFSPPRMTQWERDPHTGREIVPFDVISYFKADPEYLNTLTLTEPGIYSWEHRSYPILFINLWNNDRYEGRVCVNGIQTPLRPGQHHVIAWLGQFITAAIQSQNILLLDTSSRLETLFRNYLSGEDPESSRLLQTLTYLGWDRNDDYLLLRLEADQHSIQPLSAASMIGHIETTLSSCFAFSFQRGILVIANLTSSGAKVRDLLSSLAILLRESLLKMGVSVVFHDLLELDQAYHQAVTALEMGQRSQDMRWCYRFDDYLLDYILSESQKNLSPTLLASHKIQLLQQYDEENGTDLYRTLRVYLELERNILQTAHRLFIHRSTLFYRLSRIQQIAGVNPDDPIERLTLQLSYYILDESR